MDWKKLFVVFLLCAVLVGSARADGLSLQLKRTNPGIAGEKSAELIFDVVNTDFNNKIEGFLWCRSPDDAIISSSIGASSGSGAQYVSEKFFMDMGPSQKAISLTIESESVGDKRTGCTMKYAPYRETSVEGHTNTTPIEYDGTIGFSATDVSGYKVKMLSYTPEVQDNADTDADESAKPTVKVSVNEIPKEIIVGAAAKVSDLDIEIVSADNESADVIITGEKVITRDGTVYKEFKKMNGEWVKSIDDNEYREIRLDKTVPFVEAPKNAHLSCPDGKETCTASEVDVKSSGFAGVPIWAYIAGVLLLIVLVAFLLGKTSN